MQFYQMNKEQIVSYFEKETIDVTLFQNEKKSPLKAFFQLLKECKEQSSYVLIVLFSMYAINTIFSILNMEWNLLWSGVVLLVLSVLFFIIKCHLIQRLRIKYIEHIEAEDNKVKILKDGILKTIDSNDLRCGDYLVLEKGTILGADARIIDADQLYADEERVFGKTISSKKNDSAILEKNLYPEDQANMVWAGSYITVGSGLAIVVAVGEDTYIFKTGRREKRKQKSAIYNQKNNIGKITALLFLLVLLTLLLLAGFITGRWLEAILMSASFLSLFLFEPAAFLTQWAYFYSANKFYKNGVLVRNIQAFDGMSREKEIFIESSAFLMEGEEEFLNYMGEEKLNRTLRQKSEFSLKEISLNMVEEDAVSYALLTGYWKDVLPFVSSIDETLIQQINSFESRGCVVGFLASKELDFIPKHNKDEYIKNLELRALILVRPAISDELYQKINRLKKSGSKILLDNHHSAELGDYLTASYELDGVSINSKELSYSLPRFSTTAVLETAEEIKKQNAAVIYKESDVPLRIIYDTKCLICGIERSLNYLYLIYMAIMVGGFAAFFLNRSVPAFAIQLIFAQLPLFCLCYHIITSVKNCNQSRMSLVFGGLFSLMFIIASVVLGEGAVLALGLSATFYSAFLWIQRKSYFGWKKTELIYLLILLVALLASCLLMNYNILVILLFALFPTIASVLIDYFY